MTSVESAKAATGATVNGPREADRLGRQIIFTAKPSAQSVQAPAFNYDSLNEAAAKQLLSLAIEIRKRGSDAILVIGARLIDAKKVAGHGKFGLWLSSEFGWTERTARNYMRAAQAFDRKSEIVSVLPPTVVYKLAAAPSHVREQILARTEAGQQPTKNEILDLVAEARQQAQVERLPAKAQAALKRKTARHVRRKNEREEQRQACQREQAEELAAEQRVAALLTSKLENIDLRELISELKKTWWGHTLSEQLFNCARTDGLMPGNGGASC